MGCYLLEGRSIITVFSLLLLSMYFYNFINLNWHRKNYVIKDGVENVPNIRRIFLERCLGIAAPITPHHGTQRVTKWKDAQVPQHAYAFLTIDPKRTSMLLLGLKFSL